MKIALLTLHAPYNFGSNLQAFTTVRLFQKMGHQVSLLDYRSEEDSVYYRRITPESQQNAHEQFLAQYLPLTERLTNDKDLTRIALDLRPDAIVVGSDAVLRISSKQHRRDIHSFGNPYWLQWVDRNPALSCIPTAYLSVSSMGSNYILLPYAVRMGIRNAIINRNYISVRDRWTRLMLSPPCLWHTKKIYRSMDPVFALDDVLDLSTVSISRFQLPKKYILFCGGHLYSRNHRWICRFAEAANKRGLQVVELPTPEYWSQNIPANHVLPPGISPLEWIKIIADSQGYVGIRFHSIVVAILCGTPFFAIDDYGNNLLASVGKNFPSKTYDLCLSCSKLDRIASPQKIFETDPSVILAKLEKKSNCRFIREYAKEIVLRDFNSLIRHLPITS